MAKRKKTRQQKIIADLRRKLQMEKRSVSSKLSPVIERRSLTSLRTGSAIPRQAQDKSLGFTTVYPEQSRRARNDNYSYLFHDLSKTGILTGGIIAAQLILFFLLKNHIIVLPMVKY